MDAKTALEHERARLVARGEIPGWLPVDVDFWLKCSWGILTLERPGAEKSYVELGSPEDPRAEDADDLTAKDVAELVKSYIQATDYQSTETTPVKMRFRGEIKGKKVDLSKYITPDKVRKSKAEFVHTILSEPDTMQFLGDLVQGKTLSTGDVFTGIYGIFRKEIDPVFEAIAANAAEKMPKYMPPQTIQAEDLSENLIEKITDRVLDKLINQGKTDAAEPDCVSNQQSGVENLDLDNNQHE